MEIMKTLKTYGLLLLLLAVFTTCKKENMCDCLKRTGDVITEERTTDPFTKIYVQDRINVIITEDTQAAQHITVEAGSKLIGLIRTEVVNGELRIRNDNRCDFTRRYDVPVNVYIRVSNNITKITSKGTGEVSSTNALTGTFLDLETLSAGDISLQVNAGDVYTHQHSQGDVILTGNANAVIIYNTGGGFSITDECVTPYAWVYTRTTGKITVFPSNLLIAEIEGSGNVYYRGQPGQLNTTINGTGRVLPLQ
jgi:hypothetical protein